MPSRETGRILEAQEAYPSRYFEIPSKLDAIEDAVGRIQNALRAANWRQADIDDLELGVREAIVNAMKHGNRFDPAKKAKIELCVSPGGAPQKLELRVTDEGQGFDRSAVRNPLDEESLTRANGRGLLLMETIFDEVRYEGNRVTLIRDFSKSPKKTAA